MEAALVSVSTGVLKPLLSKLTKLLGEEYGKLKGVRKQIKFLRDELSALSPTLEMLADVEKLDPRMTAWRDKLRELSYDLEDCIDAFMAPVDHEPDGHSSGFKRFFNKLKKLKKLKTRHEMANQIEELKASVIEASKRHKRYDLSQLKNKYSSSVDPRLQALYEDINKLVGIDGPKKHIIKLLNMEMNGSSAKPKVLSIAGCGGLGKTTLAKQVYDAIEGQFKCAAFVSVSRTPDVRKILIHIADEVKCTVINAHDDGEQQLINKLRKHLQDKRYIVVIDDVWNEGDWGLIKFALPDNDLGSKIITTTRNVTVAKYCSSQVFQMQPLSFDDSKRLFFRRVFGSENNSCYPQLEDVSEEILRKCDGLPLAIVTLSGILTNQFSKAEWDRVLNAIGSALAKNPHAEKMTAILSMSYFDIPHHPRTCLLYMSMFPEDYEIEKQCLINMWIAEGFIHEKEGQTKYEIGEGYFNDLINRSMIQPINVMYGQAKACRVHDIILDYLKCKASDENFVTSLDVEQPICTSENDYTRRVRRLCVSNHREKNVTLWEDPLLSHIRSVTVFGWAVKISLLPSTALRVLELGDCKCMTDHDLASIGNLFNLKYLRLCSSSIRKLPDNVGELQHLQTLDVRGTSIEELPQTIMKLQQLSHLYVDLDAKFPEGMIGKMHSLEVLTQYGVQSYEQWKSLQEFNKLTKLRTIKLCLDFELPDGSEGRRQAEGIHSHVGNLLSSCNLHNLIYTNHSSPTYPLALHSCHPAASCSIRKLHFEGFPVYMVPNWMGSLGNLGMLQLSIFCVRPEDVEILGEIPSLLFLRLGTFGGTRGRIAFPGNYGFRSLRYFSLRIYNCGTSLEFEEGSMSKVEHVKIAFPVHEMECMNNGPSSLGIQHLSSLNKVEITFCSITPFSGDSHFSRDFYPGEVYYEDNVECIANVIYAAIETLPNRPTTTFKEAYHRCRHFESYLKEWNEKGEGLSDEWLRLWQIREEQANQAIDAETELEDETHDKEEEEQTDKKEEESREKEVAHQDGHMIRKREEQTDKKEEESREKEVAHQDDSGSSN